MGPMRVGPTGEIEEDAEKSPSSDTVVRSIPCPHVVFQPRLGMSYPVN